MGRCSRTCSMGLEKEAVQNVGARLQDMQREMETGAMGKAETKLRGMGRVQVVVDGAKANFQGMHELRQGIMDNVRAEIRGVRHGAGS